MALGVWHDRVNLITGGLVTGMMLGLEIETIKIVSFTFGWLFSTLIFGPDSDIIPKKRSQFLRFFLFPYSLLSKHRGLSHHFLWGTFLRNLYLLGLLFILSKIILFLDFNSHQAMLSFLNRVFDNKMFIWFLLGQWLSDSLHLLTDKFYDKIFGSF